MDIDFLASSSTPDPIDARLEHLIGAIGSPRFDDTIMSFAAEELRSSHVTAFACGERGEPRVVLALDRGEASLARRVAAKYIRRYWNLDPANKIFDREPRIAAGATIRLRSDEIDDADYRRDCYRQIRLVDRFSLVRWQGDDLVRLNFYRDSRRGGFADGDLKRMARISGVLLQIVATHDQLRPSLDGEDRTSAYSRKLRSYGSGLSEREIQVCSEIVLGRTSEAIAERLGLSINTVLTHRKRAYTKLGISSQNELCRIALQ